MSTATAAATDPHTTGVDTAPVTDDTPFPLPEIKRHVPWWPFTTRHTYKMVQEETLGAIKIGRRRLLTRAIVEAFAKAHTSMAVSK